jgi:hypothetical protein
MKTVVAVALIFCLVKASFAQDIGGRKTQMAVVTAPGKLSQRISSR